MDIIGAIPFAALLLCSLMAGFLFAFAVVVMPGIRRLDDRGFLETFKAIDRVIQDRQPIFILVWAGSLVTLVALVALGLRESDTIWNACAIGSLAMHALGVQLPTAAINVPLNNRLQRLDLAAMSAPALAQARSEFETRWNRWNVIRTVVSVLTLLPLLALIQRA